MTEFIILLRDYFVGIGGELSDVEFSLFGYNVNLLSVIVVCIILSMVVSIFWKGAKG